MTPEKQFKAIVEEATRREIIDKMTNWQRNQAAKACKGAWRKLSIERLEYYINLKHWKTA